MLDFRHPYAGDERNPVARGFARTWHDMPIIFITAFPADKIRSQAMAQGAVCFLDKHFEGEALSRCIDIALKANTGKNG